MLALPGYGRGGGPAPPAIPPPWSFSPGALALDLRAEFQRTLSEPPAVSRRASAWWPAVVGLEKVPDAVTATVVSIGRGADVPAAGAVHRLTGTLRSVADAIEANMPPAVPGKLPEDPALAPVTAAVRSVLAVLALGDDPPFSPPVSDAGPARGPWAATSYHFPPVCCPVCPGSRGLK